MKSIKILQEKLTHQALAVSTWSHISCLIAKKLEIISSQGDLNLLQKI